MNSITRLILRGVVSGNVTLTPQVLGALKTVNHGHPGSGGDEPTDSAPEPALRPDESDPKTPAPDKHLTFINPLPGRWVRRTGWAMACALTLGSGLARAEINPGQFAAANEAFTRGSFSEAARGYESIIAQQGWSAPVLFNLANAQQREGRLGQAILNYERATMLAPGNPDITTNLRLARQKAGLATEPQSHFENVAQLLTLNGWFCFGAVALFLMAVMFPLKKLLPGMPPALTWGSLPALFALALTIMAVVIHWPDLNRAIVIAPETTAGVSPVTLAQPVFKLQAGDVVSLKRAHGAFALIENRAGQEGWVKAGEVARVLPSPRQTAVPGG